MYDHVTNRHILFTEGTVSFLIRSITAQEKQDILGHYTVLQGNKIALMLHIMLGLDTAIFT